VKLRDASVGEILNECDFVLRDDGRVSAMLVLRTLGAAYAVFRWSMLAVLRLRCWRHGALEGGRKHKPTDFPPIGFEPFNIDPDELDAAWMER
jgi:hypothetical protein